MKAENTVPPNSSVSSAISALNGLAVTQAESPAQIVQARELFLEYAQSLGFSLCSVSYTHLDVYKRQNPPRYRWSGQGRNT